MHCYVKDFMSKLYTKKKKKTLILQENDEQKKSIDIKLNQSSSYSKKITKTGHEL